MNARSRQTSIALAASFTVLIVLVLLSVSGILGSQVALSPSPLAMSDTGRSDVQFLASGPEVVSTPGIYRRGDFGNWNYTAERDPLGAITVMISFDGKTVEGVEAFIAANRKLASLLARSQGSVDIDVTLNAPMAVDEYRSWAGATGINHFDQVQLRMVDEGGQLGSTLGIMSGSGDPLPDEALRVALTGIPGNRPHNLKGVFAFKGTIDTTLLEALANDPHVLVVDVTSNIARADLFSSGFTTPDDTRVGVGTILSVYGIAEHLGIDNFR